MISTLLSIFSNTELCWGHTHTCFLYEMYCFYTFYLFYITFRNVCFLRHCTTLVKLSLFQPFPHLCMKCREIQTKYYHAQNYSSTPHNACQIFVHLKSRYRETAFQQVGPEDTCQMSEQGASAGRPRRRIPSLDKVHKCPHCPYNTVYVTNYKNHLRIHTGEKPYSCIYCIYKTTTKKALVEHIRTHTGEKPFSCTKCAYGSSTRQGLTRHMQVHTGEKPYSCKECPYRAREKAALKSHMLSQHTQQ